jgi:cell division protein FtsW (lipid II flippase)
VRRIISRLALFLMLFLRITNIAERANESYSSLVAFGLVGCWLVHIVVDVGMTLFPRIAT